MPCGCETRVFSLKLTINNPNESQGKLYIAHRLEPKLKSEIMDKDVFRVVSKENAELGHHTVECINIQERVSLVAQYMNDDNKTFEGISFNNGKHYVHYSNKN